MLLSCRYDLWTIHAVVLQVANLPEFILLELPPWCFPHSKQSYVDLLFSYIDLVAALWWPFILSIIHTSVVRGNQIGSFILWNVSCFFWTMNSSTTLCMFSAPYIKLAFSLIFFAVLNVVTDLYLSANSIIIIGVR